MKSLQNISHESSSTSSGRLKDHPITIVDSQRNLDYFYVQYPIPEETKQTPVQQNCQTIIKKNEYQIFTEQQLQSVLSPDLPDSPVKMIPVPGLNLDKITQKNITLFQNSKNLKVHNFEANQCDQCPGKENKNKKQETVSKVTLSGRKRAQELLNKYKQPSTKNSARQHNSGSPGLNAGEKKTFTRRCSPQEDYISPYSQRAKNQSKESQTQNKRITIAKSTSPPKQNPYSAGIPTKQNSFLKQAVKPTQPVTAYFPVKVAVHRCIQMLKEMLELPYHSGKFYLETVLKKAEQSTICEQVTLEQQIAELGAVIREKVAPAYLKLLQQSQCTESHRSSLLDSSNDREKSKSVKSGRGSPKNTISLLPPPQNTYKSSTPQNVSSSSNNLKPSIFHFKNQSSTLCNQQDTTSIISNIPKQKYSKNEGSHKMARIQFCIDDSKISKNIQASKVKPAAQEESKTEVKPELLSEEFVNEIEAVYDDYEKSRDAITCLGRFIYNQEVKKGAKFLQLNLNSYQRDRSVQVLSDVLISENRFLFEKINYLEKSLQSKK